MRVTLRVSFRLTVLDLEAHLDQLSDHLSLVVAFSFSKRYKALLF